MTRRDESKAVLTIAGKRIKPGERRDLHLPVTQSDSGATVAIPMHIRRGERPGPTVFVTGAVHGDELNGAGIIRELILDDTFHPVAGTIMLVPVVNILGFDRKARYLPDRRDLNRSFPGSTTGSLAARFAHVVHEEILSRSDFGIDLHTGAVQRTNYPNVRGAFVIPGVERIARAFGATIIVNGRGPVGSLRRAACDMGCPTIILEAGEVWKVEPTVVEIGVRGVRNVLIELGMLDEAPKPPPYQVVCERTGWTRADTGGLLRFHVAPGDAVEKDQPLATTTDLLGRVRGEIVAPETGVILGMTTMPSVMPGEPICHLAFPAEGVEAIREAQLAASQRSLHSRVRHDLATSLAIAEPHDGIVPPPERPSGNHRS